MKNNKAKGTSKNTIGTPKDFPAAYNYGTEDPFYDQFEEQYQVIKEMKIPTRRIVLDGWAHGFDSDGGWVQEYVNWLESVFRQN